MINHKKHNESTCTHFAQIQIVSPTREACEECLRMGDDWVHLRCCLSCGHVGCCDESKNRHATAHFNTTGHPLIDSLDRDDPWGWCYIDEVFLPAMTHLDNYADHHTIDLPTRFRDSSSTSKLNKARRGALFENSSTRDKGMFSSICRRVRRCDKKNLEPLIELAVEIAREGREGRRIGTLFTFGDADAVLERSRPLILDPLAGHDQQSREIRDPNLRGTIKELAQLDGAFVVSDRGFVVSACRYLDAMASDVVLPYGLASRHLAAASISKVTTAVGIVVSESAMVRVFDDGELVAEIIPELWLMDHYNVQISQPYEAERVGDLAVLTAADEIGLDVPRQ